MSLNVHFRRTWMCSFYSHADSAWVFPPFSRKFPSFFRKVPNTKLTTIFKKCTVAGPSQGIHRNPPMYPNVRNLAQGQLFVSFPSSRYAAYTFGKNRTIRNIWRLSRHVPIHWESINVQHRLRLNMIIQWNWNIWIHISHDCAFGKLMMHYYALLLLSIAQLLPLALQSLSPVTSSKHWPPSFEDFLWWQRHLLWPFLLLQLKRRMKEHGKTKLGAAGCCRVPEIENLDKSYTLAEALALNGTEYLQ